MKAEPTASCNSCRVEGVNITMRWVACARARSPNPGLVHVPLVGERDDVRRIAPGDVLAALDIALAPGGARE